MSSLMSLYSKNLSTLMSSILSQPSSSSVPLSPFSSSLSTMLSGFNKKTPLQLPSSSLVLQVLKSDSSSSSPSLSSSLSTSPKQPRLSILSLTSSSSSPGILKIFKTSQSFTVFGSSSTNRSQLLPSKSSSLMSSASKSTISNSLSSASTISQVVFSSLPQTYPSSLVSKSLPNIKLTSAQLSLSFNSSSSSAYPQTLSSLLPSSSLLLETSKSPYSSPSSLTSLLSTLQMLLQPSATLSSSLTPELTSLSPGIQILPSSQSSFAVSSSISSSSSRTSSITSPLPILSPLQPILSPEFPHLSSQRTFATKSSISSSLLSSSKLPSSICISPANTSSITSISSSMPLVVFTPVQVPSVLVLPSSAAESYSSEFSTKPLSSICIAPALYSSILSLMSLLSTKISLSSTPSSSVSSSSMSTLLALQSTTSPELKQQSPSSPLTLQSSKSQSSFSSSSLVLLTLTQKLPTLSSFSLSAYPSSLPVIFKPSKSTSLWESSSTQTSPLQSSSTSLIVTQERPTPISISLSTYSSSLPIILKPSQLISLCESSSSQPSAIPSLLSSFSVISSVSVIRISNSLSSASTLSQVALSTKPTSFFLSSSSSETSSLQSPLSSNSSETSELLSPSLSLSFLSSSLSATQNQPPSLPISLSTSSSKLPVIFEASETFSFLRSFPSQSLSLLSLSSSSPISSAPTLKESKALSLSSTILQVSLQTYFTSSLTPNSSSSLLPSSMSNFEFSTQLPLSFSSSFSVSSAFTQSSQLQASQSHLPLLLIPKSKSLKPYSLSFTLLAAATQKPSSQKLSSIVSSPLPISSAPTAPWRSKTSEIQESQSTSLLFPRPLSSLSSMPSSVYSTMSLMPSLLLPSSSSALSQPLASKFTSTPTLSSSLLSLPTSNLFTSSPLQITCIPPDVYSSMSSQMSQISTMLYSSLSTAPSSVLISLMSAINSSFKQLSSPLSSTIPSSIYSSCLSPSSSLSNKKPKSISPSLFVHSSSIPSALAPSLSSSSSTFSLSSTNSTSSSLSTLSLSSSTSIFKNMHPQLSSMLTPSWLPSKTLPISSPMRMPSSVSSPLPLASYSKYTLSSFSSNKQPAVSSSLSIMVSSSSLPSPVTSPSLTMSSSFSTNSASSSLSTIQLQKPFSSSLSSPMSTSTEMSPQLLTMPSSANLFWSLQPTPHLSSMASSISKFQSIHSSFSSSLLPLALLSPSYFPSFSLSTLLQSSTVTSSSTSFMLSPVPLSPTAIVEPISAQLSQSSSLQTSSSVSIPISTPLLSASKSSATSALSSSSSISTSILNSSSLPSWSSMSSAPLLQTSSFVSIPISTPLLSSPKLSSKSAPSSSSSISTSILNSSSLTSWLSMYPAPLLLTSSFVSIPISKPLLSASKWSATSAPSLSSSISTSIRNSSLLPSWSSMSSAPLLQTSSAITMSTPQSSFSISSTKSAPSSSSSISMLSLKSSILPSLSTMSSLPLLQTSSSVSIPIATPLLSSSTSPSKSAIMSSLSISMLSLTSLSDSSFLNSSQSLVLLKSPSPSSPSSSKTPYLSLSSSLSPLSSPASPPLLLPSKFSSTSTLSILLSSSSMLALLQQSKSLLLFKSQSSSFLLQTQSIISTSFLTTKSPPLTSSLSSPSSFTASATLLSTSSFPSSVSSSLASSSPFPSILSLSSSSLNMSSSFQSKAPVPHSSSLSLLHYFSSKSTYKFVLPSSSSTSSSSTLSSSMSSSISLSISSSSVSIKSSRASYFRTPTSSPVISLSTHFNSILTTSSPTALLSSTTLIELKNSSTLESTKNSYFTSSLAPSTTASSYTLLSSSFVLIQTTSWSEWNSCSKSCGGGIRQRTRICGNEPNNGFVCFPTETEGCNFEQCPVNGGWTVFGKWQKCSNPCGEGIEIRKRTCTNPEPKYGGRNCRGKTSESRACVNNPPCPEVITTYAVRLFEEEWKNYYADLTSEESKKLIKKIKMNILSYEDYDKIVKQVTITSFVKGSVITNFNVTYSSVDALQIVKVQEDLSSGKLNAMKGELLSIRTTIVPTEAPNITYFAPASPTSIRIKWSPVTTGLNGAVLAGYVLFYKEAHVKFGLLKQHKEPNDSTIAVIQGLKKFSRYTVRALAYTDNGNGVASEPVVVSTDEDVPSMSPLYVEATSYTSTSITINWNHIPAANIHGILKSYTIFYKTLEESSFKSTDFSPNEQMAELKGLRKYTYYLLSVCGSTSKGCGERSQIIQVRTLEDVPSLPPQNLFSKTLSSTNELPVSWDPVPNGHVNGILLGFVLKYTLVTWLDDDVEIQEENSLTLGPNEYSTTIKKLRADGLYKIRIAAFTRMGLSNFSTFVQGKTCRCPPRLYTNYWIHPPYTKKHSDGVSGLFAEIVFKMAEWACGDCTNGHGKTLIDTKSNGNGKPALKEDYEKMQLDIEDVPEISFPVPGNKFMSKYMGLYSYFYLVESPGMVFITVSDPPENMSYLVMHSIVDCFPLFFIAMCFAFITGFAMWIIEMRANPEQFPHNFTSGAIDGFWCSFITMTTVGYGDRVPATILGRLFTIFWTLGGLALLSVVIGTISTALSSVSLDNTVNLYATKVAAFHKSPEQKYAILKNALINKEHKYIRIEQIKKALKDRIVKGTLIDTYVAAEYKDELLEKDITVNRLLKKSFGYGVVLSGKAIHLENRCHDYLMKNRRQITRLIEHNTKEIEGPSKPPAVEKSSGLFDINSPLLQIAFIVTSIGLVIATTVGLFWQHRMNSRTKISAEKYTVKENEALIQELTTLLNEFHTRMDQLDAKRKKIKFSKKKGKKTEPNSSFQMYSFWNTSQNSVEEEIPYQISV